MERFEVVKKLGRGSYGSAVAAMRKDTKELVVIKRVDMTEMDEAEKKQAMTEAALLNVLKHPGIITYHEAFIEDDVLNIVMEYAERGDLQKAIRAQRKAGRHFSEDQILQWAAQLSLALQNIHAHHVLHRDLKTANCFLLASGVVKVGDFGIAKVLERTAAQANTQIGTPYFLSPEAVSAKPYGRASDVWGLGCVLFEVCSLRRVFTATSLLALVYKIVNEPVPEIPAHYSPELRELVASMLDKDADRRPSAADILAMPVMQRVLREMAGPAGAEDSEDEEDAAELADGSEDRPPVRAGSPEGVVTTSGGSAAGVASGASPADRAMASSGARSLEGETAVVDADVSPGAVFATARGGAVVEDAWGVGGASLAAGPAPGGGAAAANDAGEDGEDEDEDEDCYASDEYEDDFEEEPDPASGVGERGRGGAAALLSPSARADRMRGERARDDRISADLRSLAAGELNRSSARETGGPSSGDSSAPGSGFKVDAHQAPAPAPAAAAAAVGAGAAATAASRGDRAPTPPSDRPVPVNTDLRHAVDSSSNALRARLGSAAFDELHDLLLPIAQQARQPRAAEMKRALEIAAGAADDHRGRRHIKDQMEVLVYNERSRMVGLLPASARPRSAELLMAVEELVFQEASAASASSKSGPRLGDDTAGQHGGAPPATPARTRGGVAGP